MKRLPVTGSNQLLALLVPYIPDDFINDHWSVRPVRGPRWQFSPAQLGRTHLLALLTPGQVIPGFRVPRFTPTSLLEMVPPQNRLWPKRSGIDNYTGKAKSFNSKNESKQKLQEVANEYPKNI